VAPLDLGVARAHSKRFRWTGSSRQNIPESFSRAMAPEEKDTTIRMVFVA
jgi:hypothetical protein